VLVRLLSVNSTQYMGQFGQHALIPGSSSRVSWVGICVTLYVCLSFGFLSIVHKNSPYLQPPALVLLCLQFPCIQFHFLQCFGKFHRSPGSPTGPSCRFLFTICERLLRSRLGKFTAASNSVRCGGYSIQFFRQTPGIPWRLS